MTQEAADGDWVDQQTAIDVGDTDVSETAVSDAPAAEGTANLEADPVDVSEQQRTVPPGEAFG